MDTATSTTSGSESADQVDGKTASLGSLGNGAESNDQGTGGAGENPAKASPPDNSTSDDDGSALIKALSSGDLDSIGDDGAIKTTKDEPDEEPAAVAKKPAAKEPAPDESKEPAKESTEEKSDEAVPPALTAEEKAEVENAPKGYRKRLKDVLTERVILRAEAQKAKDAVEELAPMKQFTDGMVKHAAEAGLIINREDGSIDASNLRDLIEQERQLKGKSPKEIAAYYRGIAEDLDPDSTPVSIPQDLKDLVDTGTLPADEAEAIARKRMLKAKQPEIDQRRQREEVARNEQLKRESGQKAFHQAQKTGYAEIKQVAQEYINRFGEEWDPIGAVVNGKLEKLITKTDPSAWGELAKTVIEAEVAKRKAPLKKPPTTPAPTNSPPKKESDVMSEDEERRLLSAGKL